MFRHRQMPAYRGWNDVPQFHGDARREALDARSRAPAARDDATRAAREKNNWKNEEVNEALHLCLACKGCKGDCPVQVDMATYKAEFLAHYYQGRVRPPSAYAMGLIPIWAPLAAQSPDVVNGVLSHPRALASAQSIRRYRAGARASAFCRGAVRPLVEASQERAAVRRDAAANGRAVGGHVQHVLHARGRHSSDGCARRTRF